MKVAVQKRWIAKCVFAALLVIGVVLPHSAAIAHTGRTVRVGYYPIPGMINGAEPGAMKSGYAYEYLQEIASRAGWRYEYVYGRFDELYPKLKRGEIDVLPYVNYSSERAKVILFPDQEMGSEQFYLAARKRGVIDASLRELAGRKIGTSRGSFDRTPFVALMKERGIAFELVEFDTVVSRWEALRRGEIDFSIEASSMRQEDDVYAVYAIPGEFPYHLAVAPGHYDIVAELNAAQKELAQDDPGFLHDLKFRHFSGVPIFKMLSPAAENWLKGHDVIRIGSYNNQKPFAYRDGTGKIVGIAPDCIALMFKELGINARIEWVLFDGRDPALQVLKKGEVDLIYPYYRNRSDAEREGVVVSSTVFDAPFGVLYRGDYTEETLSVIASLGTRLGTRFVRDEYPQSKCIACGTGQECVRKVLDGEATCAVMYLPILQQVAAEFDGDLKIKALYSRCDVCFAALPANAPLICMVNKAIPYVDRMRINEIENRHAVATAVRIGGWQFFRRNPVYLYGAAIALLLLVVVMQLLRRRTAMRYMGEVEKALLEAEVANVKLTEQKSILDYFISSFASAYSMDLAAETFNILRMKHKLSKTTGENGVGREQMLKFIEKHVHPDDRAMMLRVFDADYIRNRLKDEPSFSFTVRERFGAVETTMRGVIIRGRDADHVAVGFTDITEELRLEKEHQRQLAMAEARTKFFFNVSHDVRTPVHAIMGLIDICLDSFDDREKVKDCLAKMKASGGLLLSIIKSVLDMSRIEAGKVKPEETCVDVLLSFHEIEPALCELANEKNIDLRFSFGEIRDRYVMADYEKCSRVFVNLVTNAVKYTPNGGRVDVKCEQVSEKVERLKSCNVEKLESSGGVNSSTVQPFNYSTYRYTFADNGVGMSEEFQKKLYEKFSREKTTTMCGVGGLGLGMAIVKSFVELLGGTVECRSKQGEGTTFTVTLPFRVQEGRKWMDPDTGALRDADAEEKKAGGEETGETSTSHVFTGKRVLLVDDTAMSRLVALHYLKKTGVTVDIAVNGQEAVEKVKSKSEEVKSNGENGENAEGYDLVLMDMQMPVMNGIEAAKAIRAAGIGVPILAWTANAYDEDVQRALDAGMNGHVAKGTKSAVLAEMLARYIGQR